jgi:hypothetical protein
LIKFWFENLKVRDYLEDIGVDGNIFIMDLREKGREGVYWMASGSG